MLQLQAARALHDFDAEVVIFVEQRGSVVGFVSGVEHSERAAAEQFEDPRIRCAAQLLHFALRQQFQRAARRDLGIDRRLARRRVPSLFIASIHAHPC